MEQQQPRITISIPCFGRPQRTRRSIIQLKAQTVKQWEAFIIGDCCPVFEEIKKQGWLDDKRIISFNWDTNHGGSGFYSTNYSIQMATGKYFILFSNDDSIEPNHMESYLEEIEGTNYDFVYFNDMRMGHFNKAKLKYGGVGDNSIIFKTEFLKKLPPRNGDYGHDWITIKTAIDAGAKYKKSKNKPTYHIMSTSTQRQDLDGLD